MMRGTLETIIHHSRAVLLLLAFILLIGTVAYRVIPKESSPDVKIPIIYVSVSLEGISPEDGERLLLRPLEKSLRVIEGIKHMKSHASEGFGSVVLEFEAGFNSEKALQDVREKVDEAKPELPEEAEEPVVTEVNFSLFPVVNVILTGEADDRTLVTLARNLRDKIEAMPNVLEARIGGNREEMLEITVDPKVLESYQLSPAEVFQIVDSNNILIPAGELKQQDGTYAVKLPGLIEDLRDLLTVPVKIVDGTVITFSDVAKLRRTFKDAEERARVNGERAVALEIVKRSGANVIETVAAVRELVERERQFWPEGIKVVYSQDTSNQILDMLSDLENNVIFAILLVIIMVVAVMDFRSSMLVAISVPGSFLMTILCLYALGMTLNIVVLFSLIMAVGMVVDAATIVCEYADRRMMDGVPPKQAYPEAARRMAWPVFSSTLTVIVVFLPLLFWPGVVGQFMKYLPITMIFSMTAALLMALVFIPAIGALMKPRDFSEQEVREILAAERGELEHLGRLTNLYTRILYRLLKTPVLSTLGLLAFVVLIFWLYVTVGKGVEFFPDVEPENASVQIRARGNLSLSEKDAVVKEVEKRILSIEDVRVFYARSGKFSQSDLPEDLIGMIQMEFHHWQERRRAAVVMEEIRNRLKDIPGIVVEVAKQEGGPQSGKPIQLELTSRFPELLPQAAAQVLRAMEETGGFVDVQDDRSLPGVEWRLEVNRELAAQYEVSVGLIGNFVKLVTNGIKASTYRPDDADDEIDIMLRFPPEYRNLDQLDSLRVTTDKGSVPIGNFVTRQPQPRVSTLHRIDGQRVITIKADVAEGEQVDKKVRQLVAWFEKNPPDPRVTATFRGEDEDQKESQTFLSTAFLIALFGIALVLVIEFNSIYDTFVVMTAIFFSTVGVLLGLMITAQPFGIVMCGLAIIVLAGVVVSNNIIFIDTYNLLKKEGYGVIEALQLTGAQRFRPILLTVGTTVLGLIPMVFAMNIDFLGREVTFDAPSSQWWTQLSTAIAGGLSFATVLTLFFTPCFLLMGYKVGQWRTRRRERKNLRKF